MSSPGAAPNKNCPSCGKAWPQSMRACTCGYAFLGPGGVAMPAPAKPAVMGVPVVVSQPSALPSYLCPRCSSPYTNPRAQGTVDRQTVLILILFGFCLWPLWGLALYMALTPTATTFECHTCGFCFAIEHGWSKTKRKVQIWTAVTTLCLLAIQIGVVAIRNSNN